MCKKPLWADAAGMTIRTPYLGQISQIDWMLESRLCGGGKAGRAVSLGHERVALVAVLADDLAVGGNVLAVMATEASVVIVVPKVVGMGLPVQFHFGECRAAIDCLHFVDGIADFLHALLDRGRLRACMHIDVLRSGRVRRQNDGFSFRPERVFDRGGQDLVQPCGGILGRSALGRRRLIRFF